MRKLVAILLVFFALLTSTACANNELPSETEASPEQAGAESQITTMTPTEGIEFYGETYLIGDVDYTEYDEDGTVTFVLFNHMGFIGLADENGEILYQQVAPGQKFGDAVVAEGTKMGFYSIDGMWELTESDVRFTGSMEFTGALTKTPENELEFLAPGTLTFTPINSESGFIPYRYGDDDKPLLILEGYDPETDYPSLFAESDTIYVNATFDYIRILSTERATGMNYATLAGVELMDDVE